ncbi:cobalt-precorrin 5A hydrolase [Veillonella caviae]|uniref:cobalt-precorrin 5A hydrolase n=1 Tax=Veillonella caviae TaxID=248316 RepID=UPI0023F5225B|nr:cobalamin biosynthesis protein [Veillonella caviae]MCI6406809.1 cobalamin biosynthesis protein [Veillonella caviae]MDY6225536.1 cobalamin biosynthesis protein [Veillonella caviae]
MAIKTAILSVSKRGAELGQRIKALVAPHAVCYEKTGRESGGEAIYFDSLKPHMGDIFKTYDQVLCIMALGIVVRMIAPYIEHKSKDPAIVVMDEAGHHTISLLSGHLGGANEWATTIALAIDSDPVITTATDVNGLPAPDVWARNEQLTVDDFNTLIAVNSAVVAGEQVNYYIDESIPNSAILMQSAGEHVGKHGKVYGFIVDCSSDEAKVNLVDDKISVQMLQNSRSHCVVVTDKIIPTASHQLILRPKTFTMGIGCRRDTPKELILEAITQSLEQHRLSPKSLLTAASVIVKQDEVGLLEAMRELGWPIKFYEQEEMEPIIEQQKLHESTFVKGTIGVGNVCETTALLAAKSQTLIQEKTIYPKTTIAIAQVTSK